MMNFSKMVASKKGCTCMVMAAVGAMAGFLAAKMIVKHCCYSSSLACKAKKAFKAVEEKIAP